MYPIFEFPFPSTPPFNVLGVENRTPRVCTVAARLTNDDAGMLIANAGNMLVMQHFGSEQQYLKWQKPVIKTVENDARPWK